MRAHQNPFSLQRLAEMPYQYSGAIDLKQLCDRFQTNTQQSTNINAIVGPHGCGKSTLLFLMGQEFLDRGYEARFYSAAPHKSLPSVSNENPPPGNDRFQAIGKGGLPKSGWNEKCVLFLDCGECLNWWQWRKLKRLVAPARVLLTLHKAGRAPTLYECQPSVQDFWQLTHYLIAGFDAEFQAWFLHRWDQTKLANLFNTTGGNVRQCFFQLYDHCSGYVANQ